jgi:hypothetical protein
MSTSGGSPRRTRTTQRSATPPAVRAKLAEIEAKIRTRKTEVAYVVDRNGEVLFKKSGSSKRINFTPDEMRQAKDAYFTHNHPSVVSFSTPDVSFAMTNQVAEMRAADAKYTYSLRPGPHGWDRALWNQVKGPANSRMATGKMLLTMQIRRGDITQERANEEWLHPIWTDMAQRFGFIYERTPA